MKTLDAITLTPVQPTERVFEIDVLRGFALLGVLMAYALWNLGSPSESSLGRVDQILNVVLSILIDTKAYTVFAFLFGLGFSIQLNRAATRGVNIVRLYSRRLVARTGDGRCGVVYTGSWKYLVVKTFPLWTSGVALAFIDLRQTTTDAPRRGGPE